MEQRPELWARHLAAVCLAAVVTLTPRAVALSELTYGAPGEVERIFDTRSGAAPHLTYWIERLGANAAIALRSLTHRDAYLAIPGVAMQVADIASDPASINDPQLKANLEIWRSRIVPELLIEHPDLARQIQDAGLGSDLLNPSPAATQFVGTDKAARAQSVRKLLASGNINLSSVAVAQSSLINKITDDAGARSWNFGQAQDDPISVSFAVAHAPDTARRIASADPAYDDAMQRGDSLTLDLRAQLPDGGTAVAVKSVDQFYDLLGRSVLYNAGAILAKDSAARATLGSLCQRSGDSACRSAMAPLIGASEKLRVIEADRYNSWSWTTWLQQPIATTLLTITSLLLSTLSSLVVSVLPFAIGVAKAMAILISVIGTWMLLWPGRARIALSWMVGPISFVSLWSVLFNIWSDIEPALAQLAVVVGDNGEGSYSARRLMTIAISLGYMGLPSLALGVVYGESGRALYHASARLETALLMAWHTRGTIAAFGRRWIVNSPMVRRWNQRAYRAVGMGPLRPGTSKPAGAQRSRKATGSSAMSMSPRSRAAAPVPNPNEPGSGATMDLFPTAPAASPTPQRPEKGRPKN